MSATSTILLWLFVINLGVAFGAGLYEHRIVAPTWLSDSARGQAHWNADAARGADTGRRFWAFATTIPLTLLTLANLAVAWTSPGPLRWWWLTAALASLADRILTFAYFIPTMIGLMKMADSPQAVALATRWLRLNNLRHAMVFVAWLASLRVLSLSGLVRH